MMTFNGKEMLEMHFNTKGKAERVIMAGRKKYIMKWKEYYNSFENRYTYIVWYIPKRTAFKPMPIYN